MPDCAQSDRTLSLSEAQSLFLDQLQRWQAANAGNPISRTTAEWQAATGLDAETLTRVRQSLRAQGKLNVDASTAWMFSAAGSRSGRDANRSCNSHLELEVGR